jgi:hypothetical protein
MLEAGIKFESLSKNKKAAGGSPAAPRFACQDRYGVKLTFLVTHVPVRPAPVHSLTLAVIAFPAGL